MSTPSSRPSSCGCQRRMAERLARALWLYWTLTPTNSASRPAANQNCPDSAREGRREEVFIVHPCTEEVVSPRLGGFGADKSVGPTGCVPVGPTLLSAQYGALARGSRRNRGCY